MKAVMLRAAMLDSRNADHGKFAGAKRREEMLCETRAGVTQQSKRRRTSKRYRDVSAAPET